MCLVSSCICTNTPPTPSFVCAQGHRPPSSPSHLAPCFLLVLSYRNIVERPFETIQPTFGESKVG
jgi:hypothetical protein